MSDQHSLASEQQFNPGDLVTYRYGSQKVHATVHRISKTGQRVRIKFKYGYYNVEEHVYVKPKNLERGHV